MNKINKVGVYVIQFYGTQLGCTQFHKINLCCGPLREITLDLSKQKSVCYPFCVTVKPKIVSQIMDIGHF